MLALNRILFRVVLNLLTTRQSKKVAIYSKLKILKISLQNDNANTKRKQPTTLICVNSIEIALLRNWCMYVCSYVK